MNDLQKLFEEVQILNNDITRILKKSNYEEAEDLSSLIIDEKNPEQLLLKDQLRNILNLLQEVKYDVDYLSRPIKFYSKLRKEKDGKYETENGKVYYSSGAPIEALIYSDYNGCKKWVATRVEFAHDIKDYYLYGYKDVEMNGLDVRVR